MLSWLGRWLSRLNGTAARHPSRRGKAVDGSTFYDSNLSSDANSAGDESYSVAAVEPSFGGFDGGESGGAGASGDFASGDSSAGDSGGDGGGGDGGGGD